MDSEYRTTWVINGIKFKIEAYEIENDNYVVKVYKNGKYVDETYCTEENFRQTIGNINKILKSRGAYLYN